MKRSTFITWDQLKVGVMICAALAVLLVAVFKLGQAANLFAKRYTLIAFLPNAIGLKAGGQVTIAGQTAGTIRSIEFLPVDADTSRNLRVVMELDEAVQEQVRADSRGRLRTLGLLGDKVLDVTPGTPRYNKLKAGDTLAMGQSLDYDQVIAQASGAVGDLVQLTSDLKTITGGIVRGEGTAGQLITNRSLYDELTSTLQRTNQLMARLQNPNGTVGQLLDDPTLYRNLTGMVSSVDTLVRQLNSREGTVGKLLHDDSLYTKLVGVATGADSLVKLVTKGNGLANKLLTDQQLYDQLNKAITDLNAILADVRRDPRKYTKGMVKVF
jgi:phospholipid/cholesterol/gamma-HCH transport system substrate-binding protein